MRLQLKRILAKAGFSAGPVGAFDDCPALEEVSLSFINFVSPWLVLDGHNLAAHSLREAILCYDRDRPKGREAGYRSFLRCLAATSADLSRYRVSVKDCDGLWIVWSYDVPLMRHLANHKRSSIQIRPRETPIAAGPVMIKLLAAIGSTKDLEVADLNFNTLLAGSAA